MGHPPATGTACFAQKQYAYEQYYFNNPNQDPYVPPDGPYDNDPFYCFNVGTAEHQELRCTFLPLQFPAPYSVNRYTAANSGQPSTPTVKAPTPPKPKGYGVFLACQFNNAVDHLGDKDFVKTALVLHAGTAILVLTGRVKWAAAGFVALTLFDFGTANIDRIKCTKEAYGDGPSALDNLAPQGD